MYIPRLGRKQSKKSKTLKAKQQAETTAPSQPSPNCHLILLQLPFSLPPNYFFTLSWPLQIAGRSPIPTVYLFYPPFPQFPLLIRSALHVSDSITTTQQANIGSIPTVFPGK